MTDFEEQGPNHNDPYYDGNNEGIPDLQQGNAGSFWVSDKYGQRHYITLEVPERQQFGYPHQLRASSTQPSRPVRPANRPHHSLH